MLNIKNINVINEKGWNAIVLNRKDKIHFINKPNNNAIHHENSIGIYDFPNFPFDKFWSNLYFL